MTQAQVGFNIDTLDIPVTAATHKCSVIDDIDGNSVTGFIMVGKNSKEYQDASKEIRIDNIKRTAKRKAQVDTSTDAGAQVIASVVDDNNRKLALAVVSGWYGFTSNGQQVPFEKQSIPKLFDRFPQWEVKVLSDLEVESNFLTA